MTYDLKTALVECISVIGEHIEPGTGHPYEVLQRARKLVNNEWRPMSKAPLSERLIIANPDQSQMTICKIGDPFNRTAIANEGWTLWQLAPSMPEVQP